MLERLVFDSQRPPVNRPRWFSVCFLFYPPKHIQKPKHYCKCISLKLQILQLGFFQKHRDASRAWMLVKTSFFCTPTPNQNLSIKNPKAKVILPDYHVREHEHKHQSYASRECTILHFAICEYCEDTYAGRHSSQQHATNQDYIIEGLDH